ncbi:hypothetical protein [Demequina pelophila]|uniref:hypothetical protein n=1 Tax=Demequina pelophila TaxID=1638984 RepID=UPI0007830676|nr:hypothetical protein [Demequina pelophila]
MLAAAVVAVVAVGVADALVGPASDPPGVLEDTPRASGAVAAAPLPGASAARDRPGADLPPERRLYHAILVGNLDLVRALVREGAPLDATYTSAGLTAPMVAMTVCDERTAIVLARAGAPVEAPVRGANVAAGAGGAGPTGAAPVTVAAPPSLVDLAFEHCGAAEVAVAVELTLAAHGGAR